MSSLMKTVRGTVKPATPAAAGWNILYCLQSLLEDDVA